ncbi:hypothetical protein SAMN05216387_102171 [Nitrosovibrio tenuis]|uniref:Uncharacterized protein n=1 Tax=Nitrosovibrio tenuis TaxID=1233 RepID=A0A1H7IHI5_9PROT|nr:hypothetical protein SAMN05216387_102171 [Nitrosovibrio tenuis]
MQMIDIGFQPALKVAHYHGVLGPHGSAPMAGHLLIDSIGLYSLWVPG